MTPSCLSTFLAKAVSMSVDIVDSSCLLIIMKLNITNKVSLIANSKLVNKLFVSVCHYFKGSETWNQRSAWILELLNLI